MRWQLTDARFDRTNQPRLSRPTSPHVNTHHFPCITPCIDRASHPTHRCTPITPHTCTQSHNAHAATTRVNVCTLRVSFLAALHLPRLSACPLTAPSPPLPAMSESSSKKKKSSSQQQHMHSLLSHTSLRKHSPACCLSPAARCPLPAPSTAGPLTAPPCPLSSVLARLVLFRAQQARQA